MLRDQVEAATRQYIAAPAKPEGIAGMIQGLMGGKKKQEAKPVAPLVSPFARRRAPQQQQRRNAKSDNKEQSGRGKNKPEAKQQQQQQQRDADLEIENPPLI